MINKQITIAKNVAQKHNFDTETKNNCQKGNSVGLFDKIQKIEAAKRCRICLQSEQFINNQSYKQLSHAQVNSNRIIKLPCACKDQLGMVHQDCMKFWIKIWLETKTKQNSTQVYQRPDLISGNIPQPNSIEQRLYERGNQARQQKGGNLQKRKQYTNMVKRLNLNNLKQDEIYPFYCEICHQPIYFNLIFHRQVKICSQLTKKQLALFTLPLFFTIAFLGICVNWIIQTGINLYLILFYTLMWIPLFLITIAVGIWTFTKKQMWVKGIYSMYQLQRNQHKRDTSLNFVELKQKTEEVARTGQALRYVQNYINSMFRKSTKNEKAQTKLQIQKQTTQKNLNQNNQINKIHINENKNKNDLKTKNSLEQNQQISIQIEESEEAQIQHQQHRKQNKQNKYQSDSSERPIKTVNI